MISYKILAEEDEHHLEIWGLNDPLLLRIGELLLYIWKQVIVIVYSINTVQRYFFYFIGQNISLEYGSFRTVPSFL